MDQEFELARFKWILLALVVFIISGCLSWGELMYLVTGKDAEANIGKVYEVTKKGSKWLSIEYSFSEPDGTSHNGDLNAALDWRPPANGKVPVRYTPGKDGNVRLAGAVNWIALGCFGGSMALVAFFGIRLFLQARREVG
jgi:hypothetical protein